MMWLMRTLLFSFLNCVCLAQPLTNDIFTEISTNSEFSKFAELISGFETLDRVIRSPEPKTIFAPTNAAVRFM